jgi:hypothetical protein
MESKFVATCFHHRAVKLGALVMSLVLIYTGHSEQRNGPISYFNLSLKISRGRAILAYLGHPLSITSQIYPKMAFACTCVRDRSANLLILKEGEGFAQPCQSSISSRAFYIWTPLACSHESYPQSRNIRGLLCASICTSSPYESPPPVSP